MGAYASHQAKSQDPFSPQASVRDGDLVAGRYRIEARLGKGGAATVYRALDTSSGDKVALKRLGQGASDRIVSLFELEYYTLAGLTHPNVVQVHEYGADQEGPYYTMELLEGQDLGELAPMPWQEASQCICQAAAALGLIHARRMVHRDVSPRNLWRTKQGVVKLIDFGALTTFGATRFVVGTPPCIPPEALSGQTLDQRSDLYALGASFYWLLTGTHAYPARQLRELRGLWNNPVVPVSQVIARRSRNQLPDVPAEIDALVEALLSQNPDARPITTGDLIDRLRAIADLGDEVRASVVELTLHQGSFEGRDRERRYFRRRVQVAFEGQGSLSIVEGARGEGRSRLLTEIALDARVSGAEVVRADAKHSEGPRGVMETLVRRILDANPESGKSAFAPHAGVLSVLSAAIEERLGGLRERPAAMVAGETRAQLHTALRDAFSRLTRERPWLLMVDDLEAADEASLAALLSLADLTKDVPLVMVVSVCPSAAGEGLAALRAIQSLGRRVALRPLSADETHDLVHSLFGDVPHLSRLAERVHRNTGGTPGRVMELVRHLVRTDLIRYRDGTWVLPQDLQDAQLQLAQQESALDQLNRLSEPARELARQLSIRAGLIPVELCKVLSDLAPQPLFAAIAQLVQHEVLIGDCDGYRFVSEVTRTRLLAEMDEAARTASHVRLGQALLADPNATDLQRLQGAVHVLHGGQDPDALREVSRLGSHFTMVEPDQLSAAVPALEQALVLFRRFGKRDMELLNLLVPLSVAGYFFDRRLAERYGEQAVSALNASLGLDLVRRLRPWLGRRLSLFVGLARTAFRFGRSRNNPCVPPLKDATMMFFNCVGALMGVATICLDPRGVARCVDLIEPWTALGQRHLTSFVHRFTRNMLHTVQDRFGRTHAEWQQIVAVLRDPARCPAMPEAIRLRYLGGALYASGVQESWRDDRGALAIADELSRFEIQMYHMSADQLRTMYYANQGNLELFEKYRRRAEMHAIQRGSAWQAETWGLGAAITAYLRTYDAMGLKQCYEQLSRLAKEVPSLLVIAQRCRGAYLLVRRRYKEALPHLEACLEEEPRSVVGWARAHGALAAALNGLGDHQRAKQVCERALSALEPADLRFPAMNLGLQIQDVLADAGLGRLEQAQRGLDALFEQHGAGGPLTLGALHEAATRIKLLEGQEAACRRHFAEMAKHYEGTLIPSLVARTAAVAKELRRRFAPEQPHEGHPAHGPITIVPSSALSGATLLDQSLADPGLSQQALGERILNLMAARGQARRAGIWRGYGGELALIASMGSPPLPLEVCAWAEERLMAARDDVTQTDVDDTMESPDLLDFENHAYQFLPLSAQIDGREMTVGAIVLERGEGDQLFSDYSFVRAVAQRLGQEQF